MSHRLFIFILLTAIASLACVATDEAAHAPAVSHPPAAPASHAPGPAPLPSPGIAPAAPDAEPPDENPPLILPPRQFIGDHILNADDAYAAVDHWLSRDDFEALVPAHQAMLVRRAHRLAEGGPDANLPLPVTCFAPDFDAAKIRAFETAIWGDNEKLYQSGNFWDFTATDGFIPAEGTPVTVTYSFVPDGTDIAGFNDEPAAPSELFSRFNGIYGSAAAWQNVFHQMFGQWEAITGIDFIHEPNDDGAPIAFGNPGALGVRGDIRIGGHPIDGNSNILAYNFYPNMGDMVIDTDDNYYENTSDNSLRLRNTAAHEVGHGIGMPHNCPTDSTKLMEPFINLEFDGPQHDDLRGGQRRYGDSFETNDTADAAAALGVLADGDAHLLDLSIDHALGRDFFSFSLSQDAVVDVLLSPTGLTYDESAQNLDGSCPAGSPTNSLTANNIGLAILAPDGATVLDSSTSAPAGSAETILGLDLSAGGPYYVRVAGGATDEIQTYDLTLSVSSVGLTPPPSPTPTPEPSAAEFWPLYQ